MGKTFESLITLTQVADGAQGPAADEYRVETNQEEILKFKQNIDFGWTFSPTYMTFLPYKKESIITEENYKFDFIFYSLNKQILVETDYSVSSNEVEYFIATEYEPDKTYYIYNEEQKEYEEATNVTSETFSQNTYYENDYRKFNITEFDNETGKYFLNFEALSEACLREFEEDKIKEIITLLEEKQFVIGFNIYDIITNEKIYQKLVTCSNGMTEDMATFALEATKIVAAVRDGKMEFNSEGLILTNGVFSIVNEDEDGNKTQLLTTDDDGNLLVTGTINANSGKIGGFTIGETELISENGDIRLQGANGKIIANNIELGTGASIKKYIQLGDAFLYNPLDEENGGKVISAGGFSLLQDGHLNLGSIEMYSGDKSNVSYIKTESWEISGDGQAIFKDIYADNVHLHDTIMEIGTVQNVGSLMIFKDAWAPVAFGVDEITEEISRKILVFKTVVSLKENEWIYNGNNYYKVEKVFERKETIEGVTKTWSEIVLNKTYSATENFDLPISKFGLAHEIYTTEEVTQENFDSLVDAGLYTLNNIIDQNNQGKYILVKKEDNFDESKEYFVKETREEYDFIFSAFGDSGSIRTYPFASPYSITLSDIIDNNGELAYTKKLVLGKLDDSGVDASGIGLYCDNVFLKGSLIAEQLDNQKTYYSGINTLSNVEMPKGLTDESGNFTTLYYPLSNNPTKSRPVGKILLWAGAESASETGIQKAPFRVDSLGNFYAGSGYFKGSIISEATITAATMEAARMRTAILEGWKENNQAALKIVNTEKGIGFGDEIPVDGADPQYNEFFSINKTGLKAGEVEFIKIDRGISNIVSNGLGKTRKEFVSSFNGDDLEVKYQTIEAVEGSTSTSIGFNFVVNNILNFKYGKDSLIKVSDNQTIFETDMSFNKNISYSTKMTYEQVNNGYDLYVN